MSKKNFLIKTLVYGAISVGLYAAVFIHTSVIMPYFTAGSYLAVLPIATVFVFSFAHGAFASNLWSLLGIEAVKPVVTKRSTQRPARRQDKRPRQRLQLQA